MKLETSNNKHTSTCSHTLHCLSFRKAKRMLTFSSLVIGIILTFTNCKDDDDPNAKFMASSYLVQQGDIVNFTNISSKASSYKWTFGDGEVATTEDASHTYSDTGTYTVTLVAIGNDKSSSISKDIVVGGEVNIYPGAGISEISLEDTWYTINSKYASEDTTHYIDYDNGYYYHFIYYSRLGICINFINVSETEIADTDLASYICVVDPYKGYTSKGITLGSDMTMMEDVYGDPTIYDATSYNVYYYDDLGIQFWTSGSSTKIDEIDVYYTSVANSTEIKSYKVNNSVIHNLKEKLRKTRQLNK